MNYLPIGIDISKAKFDAYFEGKYWEIKQTEKAITAFITEIILLAKKTSNTPVLFVCEASGGYEKLLTTILKEKNIAYHVAHANKVKAFAKSKGYSAKTDKIDARMISEYAQVMNLSADEEKTTENKEKIGHLVKRREQLLQTKLAEQNRLDKWPDNDIKTSIDSHVKWINEEIKKIERMLEQLCNAQDVKKDFELLTSMPSIGKLTACYLIAFLPELGYVSHNIITALVGVAPYNDDSGTRHGKRFIRGGRHALRRILYLAAVSSLRWNRELKAFYDRLVAAGKSAKVALIAVVRKIIHALNSVIKRQSEWTAKKEYSL